jgi:hypothetical protein
MLVHEVIVLCRTRWWNANTDTYATSILRLCRVVTGINLNLGGYGQSYIVNYVKKA